MNRKALIVLIGLFFSCVCDDVEVLNASEPLLTGKKWYYTKHDYIEFKEDGTNTYISSCTYVHDRQNDRILFYKDGSLYDYTIIYELTDSTLSIGKTSIRTYTTTPPKQLCERFEVPYLRVVIKTGDQMTISKTIQPADADDKSVTLYGYDPEIVKVEGETIIGISPGVTIVRAKTNDGSNLSAYFDVIVADETYLLDNALCPMIELVDLGLPSGTKWANMNMAADAPYRKGKDFESPIDVTPFVGSGWQYPTEADFQELLDNCDIKLEQGLGDYYWIQMGHRAYDYLYGAVLTSRINGNQLHLYAYRRNYPGYYCDVFPYSLDGGGTYSITTKVEVCALKDRDYLQDYSAEGDNVLIRLVKKTAADPTAIQSASPQQETGNCNANGYYGLLGRRMTAKSRHGVYIQHGRKYVK